MLTRAAGIAGVAVLICACGGPDTSPFFLWTIRPGMPLDSVEQALRQRDELSQTATVWDHCTPVDAGPRRCVRNNKSPWGNLDVVAGSDGRALYLSFAPGTRSRVFDDSLSRMQQGWVRPRGIHMDPHGVSEANPHGVAEMRNGRWRAFMTFDGEPCAGTTRPCPARIQLVDWSAGRQYADTTVPQGR